MEQHIFNFAPHVDRVTKEKWEDSGRCVLVRSPNPYKFSQLDFIQLSSDQSVQYFLKTTSIRTPKSCTPDLLARAFQKLKTGSLEEDLTISTLRDGYISPSPVEMTSQRQDLATSSYSKQAPATITANPVSVAAHRTETMTSTQELSNDCALDLSTKVVDDIMPQLLPEDQMSRVSTHAKRTLTESEDPIGPPKKKVTKEVGIEARQEPPFYITKLQSTALLMYCDILQRLSTVILDPEIG